MPGVDILGRYLATPRLIHPEQIELRSDGAMMMYWADLGGRWYAERCEARLEGERLTFIESGEVRDVLFVRRRDARVFLVRARDVERFDRSSADDAGEWSFTDERGELRGARAFLRVDLHAHWARVLSDLCDRERRPAVLDELQCATLHIAADDPITGEEHVEIVGAIDEAIEHVDPDDLVTALLDARPEPGQRHERLNWASVINALDVRRVAASVRPALAAKLRAARDEGFLRPR